MPGRDCAAPCRARNSCQGFFLLALRTSFFSCIMFCCHTNFLSGVLDSGKVVRSHHHWDLCGCHILPLLSSPWKRSSFLGMCVCVCVYVCMWVCVCMCVCVCVFVVWCGIFVVALLYHSFHVEESDIMKCVTSVCFI